MWPILKKGKIVHYKFIIFNRSGEGASSKSACFVEVMISKAGQFALKFAHLFFAFVLSGLIHLSLEKLKKGFPWGGN